MLHVLARPALLAGLTITFLLMLVRLWITFATVKRMLDTINAHTFIVYFASSSKQGYIVAHIQKPAQAYTIMQFILMAYHGPT